MDKIAYMIVLFVVGFFSASRAFYYIATPTDELYSHYRNTIDVSPEHFKKRLRAKRTAWAISTVVLLGSAFYLFFS
jgi:hypothetical protein